MKRLRSLRRAVFGARKVESIVRQFDVMVEDLQHTAKANRQHAADKGRQAYELQAQASDHLKVADRAQATANRISHLIAS